MRLIAMPPALLIAARLTAKGYGRNQPMADNGSPEGLAMNRRVELRRTGC